MSAITHRLPLRRPRPRANLQGLDSGSRPAHVDATTSIPRSPRTPIISSSTAAAARPPAPGKPSTPSSPPSASSKTTKRCSCSPASRSASSARHDMAPRVLIANSLLVPKWATWEEFRRLEAMGLTMYGQMTAGSWIYIGTQGILQGTYETFAACARRHFGGTLGRAARRHRRSRRHGRGAAAGRDHERRRLPRRRGQPGAHRTPPADRLPRPHEPRPRRGARLARRGQAEAAGAVRRPARQRRGRAAGAGAPRHHAGRADRSDLRPRRAQRLRAPQEVAGRGPRRACAATIRRSTSGGRRSRWPSTSGPCWNCSGAGP